MHIPDNYLSPSTCVVLGAAMLPVWTRAVNKVKKEISRKKMPLMGIGAAFSFMVMMFNVPLPGGTTGHAVGATLAALLLGPEAACIAVSISLLLQALLFGDGGILAFGANCFNMAFIMPYTGYYIFKILKGKVKGEKSGILIMFIASYLAMNLGALFAALEFGLQPLLFRDAAGLPLFSPYPLQISIPAMLVPHLLVGGVIEAVITIGVYNFIRKVSPESIYEGSNLKMKPIYAFILTLVCLSPLGLLAAGTAWGEWGVDEISSVVSGGKALGYIPKGMKSGFSFNAIMPDYTMTGIPEALSYFLSALVGVSIIIIIFKIISGILNRNENLE